MTDHCLNEALREYTSKNSNYNFCGIDRSDIVEMERSRENDDSAVELRITIWICWLSVLSCDIVSNDNERCLLGVPLILSRVLGQGTKIFILNSNFHILQQFLMIWFHLNSRSGNFVRCENSNQFFSWSNAAKLNNSKLSPSHKERETFFFELRFCQWLVKDKESIHP